MKRVKFLQADPPFQGGETAGFPDDVAEFLVAEGRATAVGFTPDAHLGTQLRTGARKSPTERGVAMTRALEAAGLSLR